MYSEDQTFQKPIAANFAKFEDSAEYLSSAARFMEQQRVDRVYAAVTGSPTVNQQQEMHDFLKLKTVVEQVREKKP